MIALARPQSTFDEEQKSTQGIDIVLAVDVSASMLARDFKPCRLEAVSYTHLDVYKRQYQRCATAFCQLQQKEMYCISNFRFYQSHKL